MKKCLLCLLVICGLCVAASAQKVDTVTTTSGLKYYLTKKGNGPAVPPGELAVVRYVLTLTNGTQVDSGGFSVPVPSTKVIKGFNEALTLMHVGDEGKFILPYYLAYGEKGSGPIPPKATLFFDIELLDTKAKSLEMILDSALYGKPAAADSVPRMDDVLRLFKEQKKAKFKDVYVSENDLNGIGYELMKKHPDDAIELFKLNVQLYPKSYNVYDSLAEGYMTAGNNKLAIKNYRISLKLNPKNTNATDMLKKLQAPAGNK